MGSGIAPRELAFVETALRHRDAPTLAPLSQGSAARKLLALYDLRVEIMHLRKSGPRTSAISRAAPYTRR